MNSALILPFVASVQSVFETMLQMRVQVGAPFVKKEDPSKNVVSAIIGMSGDVEGSVALSFPLDAAKRAAGIFAGSDLDVSSPDFVDAIGELANMVSGGAKAKFTGKTVSISCPSVVMGNNLALRPNSDSVCVVIPCSCDCGEFQIEVSIKQTAAAAATKDAAKAA